MTMPFPPFVKKGTDALGETRYGNFLAAPTTANTAKAVDVLFATPFVVPVAGRVDKIGFDVQDAAAGGVAKLGIYRMKASDFYPGERLYASAEVSTAAAAFKDETVDFQLDAGIYWLAYITGTLAATVSCISAATVSPLYMGMSTALAQRTEISIARAYVEATALPAEFPAAAAYAANTPILGLWRFSKLT